jgi:uncharacterized surface protein with fasciclin (FAS1) repeats
MRHLTSLLTTLSASALVLGTAATAPATAAAAPGEDSLASVLTADGNTFDRNKADFDIVTEAALAVVAAKQDSPVGLLADGSTRLTVFAPTDQAFRLLAKDLTGKTIRSERKVFNALVKLAGVDTIETVLLYHVVAGATLTSPKVVKAAKQRTKVTTAQGGKVKVVLRKGNITLVDKDRDFADATVILNGIDINRGNKQIAHAIDRVLLPLDL